MKQRIYRSNKTDSFYIYATNYQDKEDKAYMNLYFPQNSQPKINGDYIDIEIEEAKYTSYKGKIGMTIFKYSNPNLDQQDNQGGLGSPRDVNPDDLPFY